MPAPSRVLLLFLLPRVVSKCTGADRRGQPQLRARDPLTPSSGGNEGRLLAAASASPARPGERRRGFVQRCFDRARTLLSRPIMIDCVMPEWLASLHDSAESVPPVILRRAFLQTAVSPSPPCISNSCLTSWTGVRASSQPVHTRFACTVCMYTCTEPECRPFCVLPTVTLKCGFAERSVLASLRAPPPHALLLL